MEKHQVQFGITILLVHIPKKLFVGGCTLTKICTTVCNSSWGFWAVNNDVRELCYKNWAEEGLISTSYLIPALGSAKVQISFNRFYRHTTTTNRQIWLKHGAVGYLLEKSYLPNAQWQFHVHTYFRYLQRLNCFVIAKEKKVEVHFAVDSTLFDANGPSQVQHLHHVQELRGTVHTEGALVWHIVQERRCSCCSASVFLVFIAFILVCNINKCLAIKFSKNKGKLYLTLWQS